MIIVNQDKKAIHNFDNISSIQIEESNIAYELIVYDQINDRDSLGTYETRERAREVLEEIINMYKATESFKVAANRISDNVGALAIKKGFAYYMPLQ